MKSEKLNYLKQFYKNDDLKRLSEANIDRLYRDTQPQIRKIKDINNSESAYYVESLDGFVPVKSRINKGVHDILKVEFNDGTIIRTSSYHMFERHDGEWIATINIKPRDKILSSDGFKTVVSVEETGAAEEIFDLAVDHPNHRYNTNSVSSHNSGAGKSLFLQNQALNWAEQGLNVIYISLELSESLCAMRLDAMTTGYGTKEILKQIDDVNMRVRAFYKKIGKGSIMVKQLANGCTANDIRAYLKEYEIQMQRKCDAILVDYLDLCSPTNRRVDPGNLFVKDKYVSEELRNIAVENNLIMVTASQLNRGSHDEIEFDHSHIAGGISKINTADVVIGIFTTISMKEGGRYQVQFMKTRSSSGVGSKVDLKFDIRSLRIRDLEEGEDDATSAAATNILESLQKKNVVSNKDAKGTGSSPKLDNENPLKQIQALRSLVKKNNI